MQKLIGNLVPLLWLALPLYRPIPIQNQPVLNLDKMVLPGLYYLCGHGDRRSPRQLFLRTLLRGSCGQFWQTDRCKIIVSNDLIGLFQN